MSDKKEEKKNSAEDNTPPLCSKCEIPGHLEEDCEVPDSLFTMELKTVLKCGIC
jgi:hypothetical protein